MIGIVIETQKDNIKILDTNNTIQIISNMDFDSTINTKNLIAKNRTGEEITTNSSVRIREGIHEVLDYVIAGQTMCGEACLSPVRVRVQPVLR